MWVSRATLASAVAALTACADDASRPVAPSRPTSDVIALATAVSAMGIHPLDLGAVNVQGTAAAVCNAAPVRGPDEPTGGSGRIWLGEKIKNPARTFIAGGFQLTISADKQSLSWTSAAEGTYAGTSNVMTALLVKAGNASAVYYYNPFFTTDADGLPPAAGTATTDPNDAFVRGDAGLSGVQQDIGHVVVCYVERAFEPSARLSVARPDVATVGELAAYTVTVANTSPAGTRDLDCAATGDLGTIPYESLAAGETRLEVRTRTLLATDPTPYVPAVNLLCTMQGLSDVVPTTTAAVTAYVILGVEVTSLTAEPGVVGVGDNVVYTAGIRNIATPDAPPLFCSGEFDRGGAFSAPVGAATTRLVTRVYTTLPGDVGTLLNEVHVECSTPGYPGEWFASKTVESTVIGPPQESAGRARRLR